MTQLAPQEADIYMVQGDLAEPVEFTLYDKDGNPMDLTNALSITFQAKHQARSDKFSGPCDIVQPTIDPVTHLPVGKGVYNWQAGNTDKPGWYDVTFRVVWADGTPQTVPNYTVKQLYIRAA